jgi:hypothetical protein
VLLVFFLDVTRFFGVTRAFLAELALRAAFFLAALGLGRAKVTSRRRGDMT